MGGRPRATTLFGDFCRTDRKALGCELLCLSGLQPQTTLSVTKCLTPVITKKLGGRAFDTVDQRLPAVTFHSSTP